MKTKLLFKAMLAVLISMSAFTAAAFEVDDFAYEETSTAGRVRVTGFSSQGYAKNNNGTIGNITIPSTVTYNGTNYRVFNIKSNAFHDTNITGLRINWGTYSIDPDAFINCTKLTYVHLASSVGWIGTRAFQGCTALKNVYMNSFDLPTVYSGSFPSNSGMKLYINYEMTKSPDVIKSTANFTMFKNVEYDNYNCSDIYISSTSDQYGYGLTIGSNDSQGYGETHDATVTYFTPDYATIKGRTTSSNASTYNKGVYYKWTKIGRYALPANNTVTSIDLTDATNLTHVNGNAFSNSTALTKITLPKSLYSWTFNAIYGCTALTEIAVNSNNTSLSAYSGCLYNKSQSTLYQVPQGKSGIMGVSSFPNTLKTVYSYAFYNCAKVTAIYIPYGVKEIQMGAFYGTTGLDYTRIPSSVTTLSNQYVFYGTKYDNFIYCNMQNPPTVTASSYFGNNSSMRLYIPYGRGTAYSSAGWTGFSSVNLEDRQALDIAASDLGFTVTSTAATTINGTSYDGRAKVVCYNNASPLGADLAVINIPASVSSGGKTYAVTKIGEDAFNGHRSTQFDVTGCANVDTVGAYAFQDQYVKSIELPKASVIDSYAFHRAGYLTTVKWSHNLRTLNMYAFCSTGLSGTVALPYGVNYLGVSSLGYNPGITRLIVPGSVNSHAETFCKQNTKLTELVFNRNSTAAIGWTFDLEGVPTNCYIRVPMGLVNHYKQNSNLSSRAAYITGGAYDFAYGNDYTGRYYLTITSNSSTTFDGTTYAGKAKYVYHPNIKASTISSNYSWAISEEDATVSNDKRTYLITELGDSLLAGVSNFGINNTIPKTITRIGHDAFYNASKVSVANLTLPDGLTYIGDYAFNYTQLSGEIKIPASVTYIGKYVFNHSNLNALYFPGAKPSTLDKNAWGTSNASNFTVWVNNDYAYSYLTTANGWGTDYGKKLSVYVKPLAANVMFSSVVPTDLQGSGIAAYYASAYDKNNNTAQVTFTKANMAPENTGLLLVDVEKNKEYRIKRPTTSVSAPMTNYLVAASLNNGNIVDVYSQTVGYRWNFIDPTPHFVRPTSSWTIGAGSAYLKLTTVEAGSITDVYSNLWPKPAPGGLLGDLDKSGVVDVEDVNAAINIALKLKTISDYPGNGDMDGNGYIDIEDVNTIINKALGLD